MNKESQIISSIYDIVAYGLIGVYCIAQVVASADAIVTILSILGLISVALYLLTVVEFLSMCALDDPKADLYKKICRIHSYASYLFFASSLISQLTVLIKQGFFSQ